MILAALAAQGSGFANQILNPDPFVQDSPVILAIRDRLGIQTGPKVDYSKFFDIGGQQVPANSGVGIIAQTSQDFVNQLSEMWSGGLSGLGDILEQAR